MDSDWSIQLSLWAESCATARVSVGLINSTGELHVHTRSKWSHKQALGDLMDVSVYGQFNFHLGFHLLISGSDERVKVDLFNLSDCSFLLCQCQVLSL